MTLAATTGFNRRGGDPRRRTVRIEPDSWYSVDDLAAHYDLPKSTVRELIASGAIPATKVGRTWRSHGLDILGRDEELRQDSQRRAGRPSATYSPESASGATSSTPGATDGPEPH